MPRQLKLALALILAIKEGASAPCDEGVINVYVSTLQAASDLRDMLTCSGQGVFYAEWTGEVNIGDLSEGFTVQSGSSLHVTGTGGGAVIDGGNGVRLFTLTGGSQLYLNEVSLQNGRHIEGGAVHATDSSLLVATDCSFLSNTVDFGGGEVSCREFRNALQCCILLHADGPDQRVCICLQLTYGRWTSRY